MKTEEEWNKLVEAAKERYDALPMEEQYWHDYEQRRSLIRGMCPSKEDYNEWCKNVDRILPPRKDK